jgi:hypothetical protein
VVAMTAEDEIRIRLERYERAFARHVFNKPE